jgi:hypothetical protein
MTPSKESAYEIAKATFDELAQTSGLSKAYLAGQFLAVGAGSLVKVAGYLGAINVILELAAELTKAARIDNMRK